MASASLVPTTASHIFKAFIPISHNNHQQGCNVGDEPISLRCGRCGYNGPSTVRKERGPANIITTVATLGIVRKKALETVHRCEGCNKDVAYSKPF